MSSLVFSDEQQTGEPTASAADSESVIEPGNHFFLKQTRRNRKKEFTEAQSLNLIRLSVWVWEVS